jgi:acyl-CoA thioester hydrolase
MPSEQTPSVSLPVSTPSPSPFVIQMEVRDYECDMQGIVNNAVYQNYLEHCRHRFLDAIGLNFAQVTEAGVHLVVIRAELDYKKSLKSGDIFRVELTMEKVSRLRFAFVQKIFRDDNTLMLDARIVGTSINPQGRPYFPQDIQDKLFATLQDSI